MKAFNLSAWAVREQAITLFLIVALALSGAYAFFALGRAEEPSFTVKTLTATVLWPGATAEEVQDLVADPLEKRLQELTWYDRVETMARPGMAVMMLTLKDNTPPSAVPEEFYQARKKLGDSAHVLPRGAIGPFVNDEYSDVVFTVYTLEGRDVPLFLVTRAAETVREKLLHVPGVQKVAIVGEQPERLYIDLSHSKLAELGLSVTDVIQTLQERNDVVDGGFVETSASRIYVRTRQPLSRPDIIGNTTISVGGRTVRLGDIAAVHTGYEEPPDFLTRHNNQSSLVLNVVMRPGWNGLKLGAALSHAEDGINRSLPVGITLTRIVNQAQNIHAAVGEFMLKFFVALSVVMLVSFISLGFRVGLVVAAAVPLTLAIVMILMLVTGRALDRITLGALIISLGLLVDDAIIAIEMMVVKLEEGMNRIAAASYAWSHTAAPMLAGTLVTIIGFTPIGFAQSAAGEYAGNIFWIVAFALITSWFVAVIFTPYLGVKFLPDLRAAHAQPPYQSARYERFRRLVRSVITHNKAVCAGVVCLFVLAFVGMGFVRQQFFPSSDRPELLAEVIMPKGAPIESTAEAARKVSDWLQKQPETLSVTSYIGGGAPRFFLAYNPELPDPAFAKIVIMTTNAKQRDRLRDSLRQEVAKGLAPEARVRATEFVFGPYTHFPIMYRVMGPDAQTVSHIAQQVSDIVRADPETRQVNTDWGEKQLSLHFVMNQSRLAQLSLSPDTVSRQTRFMLQGISAAQATKDIRSVDLIVRSDGQSRADPARLLDQDIIAGDGRRIPLRQIGMLEYRSEEPVLWRRDRIPTMTVQADINDQLQPPEVAARLDKVLQPLRTTLPEGYRIETGGNTEESAKANAAMAPIFPIMILLMLGVIVVETRSLSAMTMVFLTAPLGLIGMVPTLLLFHQPFGFNAILGLIGLSGILMRNTLILIGQIHTNLADGMEFSDAVVEATVQRARPVILTALAAVLAFIPLTESIFWGALAFTLIGGTAAGTVLTLLFLPALYTLWPRKSLGTIHAEHNTE
ncbi:MULTISPECIES: efflux RND transporter permease subunit [Acetobacter]|nr:MULTISPECIES: efflux RND transporter permease subunit [Acetobacter]